jgi:hypothetical protein
MYTHKILINLFLVTGMCLMGLASRAGSQPANVVDWVNSMPNPDPDGRLTGPDPDAANVTFDQILAQEANVNALADMLIESGGAMPWKVLYVMHCVLVRSTRPGAEAERMMVNNALVSALERATDVEVRRFIILELALSGGQNEAQALQQYLDDEDLGDYAARAIASIADEVVTVKEKKPEVKSVVAPLSHHAGRLVIMNLQGKTILEDFFKGGKYVWDGKDRNGNQVSSGMYLIKMQGQNTGTRKTAFISW